MAHHPMNKKTPLRGGFCSKGPNVKNQFFDKNIWSNFLKKIFCPSEAEIFLIRKWFYFFSFAQNWTICEGLKFSLLKMDDFPFSGVSAPETPEGVKIRPKMVPMIFTCHMMKVYGEIGPKIILKFQSV